MSKIDKDLQRHCPRIMVGIYTFTVHEVRNTYSSWRSIALLSSSPTAIIYCKIYLSVSLFIFLCLPSHCSIIVLKSDSVTLNRDKCVRCHVGDINTYVIVSRFRVNWISQSILITCSSHLIVPVVAHQIRRGDNVLSTSVFRTPI